MYGSALTAEHLAAHPLVHVGHKGLFFDRLDVGVVSTLGTELPRLAPYAHLVVQMRNRAYLPSLGRFLQRDPNATAMALIEASARHGRGLGAIAAAFNIEEMYGDGASLYGYLDSNPMASSDPLGLYGLEDGMNDGMEIFGLLDPLPGPGDFIRGMFVALLSEYIDRLDFDVDWGSDWTFDDEGHSRIDSSWVHVAIGQGLRSAFDIDIPFTDTKLNPLDLFSDRFRGKSPFRQNLPKSLVSPKGVDVGSQVSGWKYRIDTNNITAAEGGTHIHVYQGNVEMAKVTGRGTWLKTHQRTVLKRPSEVPGIVRFEANKLIRWTRQQLQTAGR